MIIRLLHLMAVFYSQWLRADEFEKSREDEYFLLCDSSFVWTQDP